MKSEEEVATQPQAMVAFNPSDHASGDIYKLMVGSIVPRPIALVSSIDVHGVRNLAPFSYFTACTTHPPVIAFCIAFRPTEPTVKDTLRNIMATREFVVNIVSEDFAEQMNETAAQVPPDVDEFALSGLTPLASELVKAPRVAESRVQMECRLHQIVHIGDDQPGSGSLVLGEILRFHVREDMVDNYRIDPDKLSAIGRMAGSDYVRTTDRFALTRPK